METDGTGIEDRLRRHFERRANVGVVSAYLFGSHGGGRAHRESDIDIGVLLDRDRYPTRAERFEVRVRLGSELIDALDSNEVDLVVLNDVPPLFGRRVVTEGLRVFLGDPEADVRYVRDVQLRAADLGPFLERTRRIKLEALRK